MRIKTVAVIFLFFALVVFLPGQKNLTFAQDSEELIPSDLSLDLNLAEQNPAPEQTAITNNEVKQAEITSPAGTVVVQPEEELAPEIKNEPATSTDHPEQITSEQEVKPESLPVTPAPESTLIPETPDTTPPSTDSAPTPTPAETPSPQPANNDNQVPPSNNDQESSGESVQGVHTGPRPFWQQILDFLKNNL